MSGTPSLFGPYVQERSFHEACAEACGDARVAGRSVEGRAVHRFDVGPLDGVPVLLTGLMHGVEVIGSVALLELVRRLRTERSADAEFVRSCARVTVLPVVNPDSFAENMGRIAQGRLAYRRGNARGVDLNRNFPVVGALGEWHPFSGSRHPWSPHYMGPHPLSEPESRTVVAVAQEIAPAVAVGFHSFGDMLLYPWAHTRARHPREAHYRALGRAFSGALRGAPYVVDQATRLYPTLGDLDDWLDARFGADAFTVEVSTLDRRLLHPLRAINPFCWMNPSHAHVVDETVDRLVPALMALLRASVEARFGRAGELAAAE